MRAGDAKVGGGIEALERDIEVLQLAVQAKG